MIVPFTVRPNGRAIPRVSVGTAGVGMIATPSGSRAAMPRGCALRAIGGALATAVEAPLL